MFSAVYAASRSLIPDEAKLGKLKSPDELMNIIASYTHFYPANWNHQCHTMKVYYEFNELYPYKLKGWLL